MSQFEEMGKAFVGFYYPAFSANRGLGSQLDRQNTERNMSMFGLCQGHW